MDVLHQIMPSRRLHEAAIPRVVVEKAHLVAIVVDAAGAFLDCSPRPAYIMQYEEVDYITADLRATEESIR